MSKALRGREAWLDANGKTVKIDGIKHVLEVSTHRAIYPYREDVISVYAEPINKNSEYYLKTKRELGDDWSTDVLDSGDELYIEVAQQAGVS